MSPLRFANFLNDRCGGIPLLDRYPHYGAATPFNDVPANDQFAPWIEYLYNQGVTAGCGGGNFCPTANISNGQMAVFLVKAFNVPHL